MLELEGGRGQGDQSPPPKNVSVFEQKIDAVWAKIDHTSFICT